MTQNRRAATRLCLLVVFLALLTPRLAAGGATTPGGICVGDSDGDGKVGINELVSAVDNALSGCSFQPVTLQFAAKVADQPFVCAQPYENIGTSASEILPTDFRFYLSNIRLLTS